MITGNPVVNAFGDACFLTTRGFFFFEIILIPYFVLPQVFVRRIGKSFFFIGIRNLLCWWKKKYCSSRSTKRSCNRYVNYTLLGPSAWNGEGNIGYNIYVPFLYPPERITASVPPSPFSSVASTFFSLPLLLLAEFPEDFNT